MTDPNLFSDPIPTASAVDARATAGNAVTADPVTGTAVTGNGAAGDLTAVLTLGDHTTATRPPPGEPAVPEEIEFGVAGVARGESTPGTALAGVLGAGAPVSGESLGLLASPEPRATSSPGAPAAGEPTEGHLLGLLDVLVVGLRALGGERVEECLRVVGRCEARLAAVRAEKVTELARWRGEAHAAAVLRGDLKQSRGGAKREVQFAERLGDLPGTAGALAEGAITPQHARTIADAAAHTPVDEAALLVAAEKEPADVFAHTVRDHVNERTADEDLEERRRRQRARREANIKKESDGMYKLFGTFDPVAGARIETALAAMAKKLRHGEDARNRATPAQRYADALELLITRRGAGKPQGTNLVVIADYDLVAGQLRDARLIDGTPLAPSEILKIALDANILPALFDTKGQPLWLGHKYRHATVAQRIALAVRDKGCVGCRASNSFCQAHHVIHWEDGGPTDIDNLCLLCSDCHHKQVHELGAQLTRGPDGHLQLEPPSSRPPPGSRNGKARNNERGVPGRRTGTTGTRRTVNQPLRR